MLPRPALCLVTAGAAGPELSQSFVETVDLAARASSAGVDLIQIRESQLSDAALFRIVRRVLGVVDRARTAVLVNDRIDVAVAAGAQGVHLRGNAMHASRVRAVAPPGFLIGRSVHSLTEAQEAEQDGGVDYLLFGTVFSSARKPTGHQVAGLEALKEVCAAVRLPVIAIGGITAARAAEVASAGAAGIAAIGLFLDAVRDTAGDLSPTVQEVRRAFDT